MKHLSFIGMMGSGKTTVAKLVAENPKMPLVDLDLVVEEKAGLEIPEIFFKYGEEKFRALEAEALKEVMIEPEPRVVATGGGVILDKENRALLKKHSVVVWLSVGPEDLDHRLNGLEHQKSVRPRPLLKEGETSLETLSRMCKERTDLYKQSADLVLDGGLMDADKLAERSLDYYKAAV